MRPNSTVLLIFIINPTLWAFLNCFCSFFLCFLKATFWVTEWWGNCESAGTKKLLWFYSNDNNGPSASERNKKKTSCLLIITHFLWDKSPPLLTVVHMFVSILLFLKCYIHVCIFSFRWVTLVQPRSYFLIVTTFCKISCLCWIFFKVDLLCSFTAP